MTDDDPGILGNLPRSRPGTRSDKRGAKPGEKKAAPATRASAAAKPRAAAKPKPATAKPRTKAAKPRAAAKPKATAKPKAAARPQAVRKAPTLPEPASGGADPVGDIVRAGEAIARSGIRVGSAIAGEAFRRLTGR